MRVIAKVNLEFEGRCDLIVALATLFCYCDNVAMLTNYVKHMEDHHARIFKALSPG